MRSRPSGISGIRRSARLGGGPGSTTIEEIDRQVDTAIAKLDAEVAAGEASFRALIALLCTIPGVSSLAATIILAEIGRDMSRFLTAGHLVAWPVCPGQNESPTGHVWMAPGSQGFFYVSASKTNCSHVSGLVARRTAAGPDGFRGSRPDQARGVALPHDPWQVPLDPSVDRRCHHASSPSQVLCLSLFL